jgi:hypothetical protein
MTLPRQALLRSSLDSARSGHDQLDRLLGKYIVEHDPNLLFYHLVSPRGHHVTSMVISLDDCGATLEYRKETLTGFFCRISRRELNGILIPSVYIVVIPIVRFARIPYNQQPRYSLMALASIGVRV